MQRQKLQQRIFLRGEIHRGACARDPSGAGLDFHVTQSDDRCRRGGGPSDECPNTRQQLVEGERFRQVIVRAGVKRAHLVDRRIAGGEDKHRGAITARADSSHDLPSIHDWNHQVKDDHVVGGPLGPPERFLAIGGDVYGEPRFSKRLAQGGGEVRLILH